MYRQTSDGHYLGHIDAGLGYEILFAAQDLGDLYTFAPLRIDDLFRAKMLATASLELQEVPLRCRRQGGVEDYLPSWRD